MNVKYEVVLPVLGCTTLGAISGSWIAINRFQCIPAYSIATALNSALISTTFFTLRGVLIHSPVVRDSSHQIAASTVSGFTTGVLFNVIKRGRTGLLGVALTYGGIGAAGETLNVARTMTFSWDYSPFRKIPDDEYRSILTSRVTDLDKQIQHLTTEINVQKKQIMNYSSTREAGA